MSKLMKNDVYNAAVNGDLTIFSNKNHEHLLKKTYQNDNIIHIAAQHQQFDFIKAALNSFPSTPPCESLICDQNCSGDTPLHNAAESEDVAIINLLFEFFSTQCGTGSDRVFPWRVMNEDGNTPAHVALLCGNTSVAMYLVDKDDYVARVLNRSKETLLHLAIQYHIFGGNPENDESQIPDAQAPGCNKMLYQPIEDLWPIVELLLKIESSVTCWADADGSTPLHRATLLKPAYRLRAIKAMLASCSEAAKVRNEGSGDTILHLLTNHQVESYEEGQELMSIPHIYALKNSKNHQRDTPLHLAARNCDTIMVRILKESSPKLGLKNKSGISADSLVRELEHQMKTADTPMEYRRKLTEEECEVAKRGNVAFLNEKLDSLGMDFLVSQTPREGNILHELMQCTFFQEDEINKAIEFTKKAIQILPSLVGQQDRNGNTLLHLMLEKTFVYVPRYSRCSMNDLLMIVHALDHANDGLYRLKNNKGDTPLHVAIRTGYYDFAIRLVELDIEVARYVNNRNQSPLHLLVDCYGYSYESLDRLINGLINGNADQPYTQDEDGLTPLLSAVRRRHLNTVKVLHKRFPASAEIADFKGRTFWHWFGSRHEGFSSFLSDTEVYENSPIYKEWILINEDDHMRRLMGNKDNDGNTPLHLAIANQQFCFAHFLLVRDSRNFEQLLAIENKEGVSSLDLIGSADHLPLQFEKFLLEMGNLLSGYRSMYSIPTTKIEAYTNTIGVIAALLATITFTAAFTVPGGLDSSNGTPLLLQNAMFQVFLVADVVAMSSSVTVLFCLLWIMTTGNKKESILLLDVSVFLLQTSFYATLVTFMAGLYVTTISTVPAIAISTCVICTLLIILLNKRLVMLTIVPFFGMLITWVPIIIRHPILISSYLWDLIEEKVFWLKQIYC